MGLDFVEIVMEVEETFGIRFRSEEFSSIQTVGDFVSLIRSRIVAATFGEMTRHLSGTIVATRNLHLRTDDLILEKLRPIFSDILNIKPNEIVLSARLIEDLRVS